MILRIIIVIMAIFVYGCQNSRMKLTIESIPLVRPLDSHEILFTRTSVNITDRSSILWAMDRNGENQLKLLSMPQGIYRSSWSPDRKKIALAYNCRKNIDEILIIELWEDLVTKRSILKVENKIIGGISWSPDNKKIAFVIQEPKGSSKIYVMDVNEKELRCVVNGEPPYWNPESPCWSPDGKKLLFRAVSQGEWEIYMMNSDGTNIERLTNNPSTIKEGCAVWSPNGKWIAFVEKDQEEKKIEKKKDYIVLMNSENKERGKTIFLPRGLYIIATMCFSPDSKNIVFEVDDLSKYNEYGVFNHEIYKVNIDGKNLKNLTNTPDLDELSPSWRSIVKE